MSLFEPPSDEQAEFGPYSRALVLGLAAATAAGASLHPAPVYKTSTPATAPISGYESTSAPVPSYEYASAPMHSYEATSAPIIYEKPAAPQNGSIDYPVPSETVLKATKIPRLIFMTSEFREDKLPNEISEIMEDIRENNPEYEILYFDAEQREAFIHKEFDDDVVDLAYKALMPGAYKADLWRYLVLYKYGGVYMDVGMQPLVPLSEIVKDSDDFVSVGDGYYGILNSFIAARAKDEVLRTAIRMIIYNIRDDRYGKNPLDVTGPLTLQRAFNGVNGYDGLHQIRPGVETVHEVSYSFLNHQPDRKDMENGAFIGGPDGLVLKRKFPGYNKVMYQNLDLRNYDHMWRYEAVFNPEPQKELADLVEE